jgi:hypothetical protein
MDVDWKDIKGYEGHYQVSNTGEVRSIKGTSQVILKGDHQRNGYKRVYLWLNGSKKNFCVHRLVAEAFIPNPLNLTDVNHIDEDKDNNSASNLEWCSHSYNMNYGSVRRKISEARRGKRLTEEQKRKISVDSSNRRWVSNGAIEMFVRSEDVESYIGKGWVHGRVRQENKPCLKK